MDTERLEMLEIAMGEINDIRNDIVGRQTIDWSAHIYPLIAILNRCGFQGMDHEEARSKVEKVDGETSRT